MIPPPDARAEQGGVGTLWGAFWGAVDLSAFKAFACTCTLALKRIDGGKDELPYIAGAQLRKNTLYFAVR